MVWRYDRNLPELYACSCLLCIIKKSYCKLVFENNEYLIKTNFTSRVMLYVSVARPSTPPPPHTNVWQRLFKLPFETVKGTFQYRISHRIIPCSTCLHNITIKDSDSVISVVGWMTFYISLKNVSKLMIFSHIRLIGENIYLKLPLRTVLY